MLLFLANASTLRLTSQGYCAKKGDWLARALAKLPHLEKVAMLLLHHVGFSRCDYSLNKAQGVANMAKRVPISGVAVVVIVAEA